MHCNKAVMLVLRWVPSEQLGEMKLKRENWLSC
jgi:hypothetical protein